MNLQLLPDESKQGPLAIGLLFVAIILCYLVFFDPYVVAINERYDEIGQIEEHMSDLQARIAQRPQLMERVRAARELQTQNDYFLKQKEFNLAAAELTRKLKDLVKSHAQTDKSCQVVSTQNVRSRDKKKFEQVRIKVRMRCDLTDLMPIVTELENGLPVLMIDNVNIYRNIVRRRSRGKSVDQSYLDVRFELVGFVSPGKKQESL
ncbi:MAG: type II secretion system protein GspM [bacterium]